MWTVPTRCACKNTPCIHMLMASKFYLLIFFLLVWNHLLHPWSARQPPIRFEWMATVLITDCVHTPGDCTRALSRWCASNHPRVALAASTPSHLLCPRRRHHDDHQEAHPKTLVEIAMVLSTNSGSFPSNSHVSATFRFCSDLGNSGIRQILRNSLLTGRWWEGLLIRWPINRSNRFSDFLRSDRLDPFGKIIKSIFPKFWKREFQFFSDFQNFFGFLKFQE